jgi:fido (protein-threonine AMPylation protein)
MRSGQTPLADISGLKLKRLIRTVEERNAVEAENIRKATIKYLGKRVTWRTARFDMSWLKHLHEEMLGDVWKWAGLFRHRDTNTGVHWTRIEGDLEVMLGNLKYRDEHGEDPLELAVYLHHEAVRIHPFNDGNGRWSRMLASIWLRLHKSPYPDWPVEISGGASTI